MASQPSAAAKTSRWGSFLTGLESKLDTILADDDVSSKAKANDIESEAAVDKAALVAPLTRKATPNSSARSTSTNRAQDRLNERLAKALASKNSKTAGDSSAAASNLPSRTSTPVNAALTPRASIDLEGEVKTDAWIATGEDVNLENGQRSSSQPRLMKAPDLRPSKPTPIELEVLRPSTDSHGSASTRPSLDQDSNDFDLPEANGHILEAVPQNPDQYESTIKQLRSDHERAELRCQEETHDFLERIDALQSKLKYLTKEAAESAKRASAAAAPGTDDKRLAAKDEKIARLIEEGQKLSQTELKHMSIIKKLRAKSMEDEKAIGESRRLTEINERLAREAQDRAKKAETAERRAMERVKSLPKLEKELESLRLEREAKAAAIESLQEQLHQALSAAQELQGKAKAEALEVDRKRTADLADELSRVIMEKDMAEKRFQAEIRELKEKAERDKERARVTEIERQGEQNMLESRLEAFRARAEEASATGTGDVQAKLLRQIETLQNQYAVASENWQGIEGSLLIRISTLEKERDEISTREGDVRRKARELNLKARRTEEDLEKASLRSQDLQHEVSQQKSQLSSLQEKLSKAEAEITEARKDLNSERETWEARQSQYREEEKARQRDELARTPDTPFHHFHNESPVTSTRNRKSSNPDRNSPHGRHYNGLAISGSALERPVSRRSSTQPLRSAETRPISRQDSTTFMHHSLTHGAVPETPSITVEDQDDFFDDVHTPASPEHTINDMISASTAAAGPSVQLVERMSAAVRRLESERAASRDELARLSQQRDDARDQVVSLMRETEGKRKADERIEVLQRENQVIQERYSTTLEMLGEKSERVEELKADVADLKQMYRELVDRTMR